jgi:ubiquinone/menaquinone biosynthesis C-methylase UbiE
MSVIDGMKAPFRLLDVGNLGDGASTTILLREEVLKRGGAYAGLDSNEPLTRTMNLPDQMVGDLHASPFPDDSFDAVYAGEIIEHTWMPGKMISECHRILKPGGLLILDTPNPYSMPNILRFLMKKEDSMGENRLLNYHEAKDAFGERKAAGDALLQPQHKIFFTPAMLKQLFETHGFVLESMGCTVKPRSIVQTILQSLFPHAGQHLCTVARKATVDEAFADVAR